MLTLTTLFLFCLDSVDLILSAEPFSVSPFWKLSLISSNTSEPRWEHTVLCLQLWTEQKLPFVQPRFRLAAHWQHIRFSPWISFSCCSRHNISESAQDLNISVPCLATQAVALYSLQNRSVSFCWTRMSPLSPFISPSTAAREALNGT